MFKDPAKQREANREQMQRARAKGNTKPTSNQSNTEYPRVTDKALSDGNMDIETLAMVDAGCGDKLTHGPKRGKDIKCFSDLPPAVQLAIDLSDIDSKEHARRVAGAIHYQHLFPDRFHSTGVAI